jgi:hypothetical protein
VGLFTDLRDIIFRVDKSSELSIGDLMLQFTSCVRNRSWQVSNIVNRPECVEVNYDFGDRRANIDDLKHVAADRLLAEPSCTTSSTAEARNDSTGRCSRRNSEITAGSQSGGRRNMKIDTRIK